MISSLSFRSFILFLLLFTSLAVAAEQSVIQAAYDQLDKQSEQTKTYLTSEERTQLLYLVVTNPVATLSKEAEYDPNGDIGFCFGRAMTAHLIARKLHLQETSIRKLFIIGDLRSGANPEWRFHVTTLVLGEDGNWYAIDPIMRAPIGPGTPMPTENWIATVQSVWDKNKKAFLYVVDRNVVMPNMTLMPATSGDESGDRVIEFKFDPSTKAGFEPLLFGDKKTYRVSPAAQESYFLHADSGVSANRFNFLRLDMTVLKNGVTHPRLFDFRNYFADLLSNLH